MPRDAKTLRITQTGGFAGVPVRLLELELEQLEDTDGQAADDAVERLIAQAGASAPQVGADLLRYEVTMRDRDGEHSWTIAGNDEGNPELLQTIDSLQRLAARAHS